MSKFDDEIQRQFEVLQEAPNTQAQALGTTSSYAGSPNGGNFSTDETNPGSGARNTTQVPSGSTQQQPDQTTGDPTDQSLDIENYLNTLTNDQQTPTESAAFNAWVKSNPNGATALKALIDSGTGAQPNPRAAQAPTQM